MLPVLAFENVFDVLAFFTHHFPFGFNNTEERQHVLKIIEDANPLTKGRKQAEAMRIEAERERDTGRVTVPAAQLQSQQSGFSQAELDAAVAKAVAAAMATLNKSEPSTPVPPSNAFSVTPSFVPEDASQ